MSSPKHQWRYPKIDHRRSISHIQRVSTILRQIPTREYQLDQTRPPNIGERQGTHFLVQGLFKHLSSLRSTEKISQKSMHSRLWGYKISEGSWSILLSHSKVPCRCPNPILVNEWLSVLSKVKSKRFAKTKSWPRENTNDTQISSL